MDLYTRYDDKQSYFFYLRKKKLKVIMFFILIYEINIEIINIIKMVWIKMMDIVILTPPIREN